jgi:hypothetical protein
MLAREAAGTMVPEGRRKVTVRKRLPVKAKNNEEGVLVMNHGSLSIVELSVLHRGYGAQRFGRVERCSVTR